MRVLIVAVSACGLLLVAAGAAGAHVISPTNAGRWDGALLYGFVHTLAALATALLPGHGRLQLGSGAAFLAGVVMFSGIQIAQMMTSGDAGSPLDGLTMLVPIGGVAFMLGWALLGAAALLRPRES
jgi:uncharacterized membrane protein YgdD (TMEM256/DUF423 family)